MVVKSKRHIAKTISYRIISTTTGFVFIYFATNDYKIGATFSLFELLYKPIIYFLHERTWWKYIKYGLEE
jgi:uncharacterized membrane protein